MPSSAALPGTNATPGEVQGFYAAALRRSDWQPDTFEIYPTSTDLNGWGWCNPDRLFRLAIGDPAAIAPSLPLGRSYTTVFQGSLRGRTTDVACPSRG